MSSDEALMAPEGQLGVLAGKAVGMARRGRTRAADSLMMSRDPEAGNRSFCEPLRPICAVCNDVPTMLFASSVMLLCNMLLDSRSTWPDQ